MTTGGHSTAVSAAEDFTAGITATPAVSIVEDFTAAFAIEDFAVEASIIGDSTGASAQVLRADFGAFALDCTGDSVVEVFTVDFTVALDGASKGREVPSPGRRDPIQVEVISTNRPRLTSGRFAE